MATFHCAPVPIYVTSITCDFFFFAIKEKQNSTKTKEIFLKFIFEFPIKRKSIIRP